MNNANYSEKQISEKIAELNADKANDFVKKNLFYTDKNGNNKPLITTSQIRKFLSAINCLENKISGCEKELPQDIANEIKYLKVKLAYQVGRNNGNKGLKKLYNELEPLISEIDTSKSNYRNVAKYVEAIVAYHKFYGGE